MGVTCSSLLVRPASAAGAWVRRRSRIPRSGSCDSYSDMTWPSLNKRTLSTFAIGICAILVVGGVVAVVLADALWLVAALTLALAGLGILLAKSNHNSIRFAMETVATSTGGVPSPQLTYTPGEPLDLLRRDIQRDVSALLSLYATLPASGNMPAPGGWAATPETLLALVSRILAAPHIDTVVECGSGTSTVWIALALKKRGEGRLISLEHDQQFAEQTALKLAELGLDEWVEIRVDGLVKQTLDEGSITWFPPAILGGIANVSLLFVDGPPAYLGPQIRFPALPLLAERLTQDAWVILDDIDRAEERAILDRWTGEPRGVRTFRLRSQTDRAAILERSN